MGIFNEHSTSQTFGPKMIRAPPGIGFILDKQGNYNMQNKKLTNVGDGCSIPESNKVSKQTDLTQPISLQT